MYKYIYHHSHYNIQFIIIEYFLNTRKRKYSGSSKRSKTRQYYHNGDACSSLNELNMNNNRAWNANGINKGALNIENYYNTDKTPVKSVRQQKSQHKFSPLADIRNVEVIHRIKSILH